LPQGQTTRRGEQRDEDDDDEPDVERPRVRADRAEDEVQTDQHDLREDVDAPPLCERRGLVEDGPVQLEDAGHRHRIRIGPGDELPARPGDPS